MYNDRIDGCIRYHFRQQNEGIFRIYFVRTYAFQLLLYSYKGSAYVYSKECFYDQKVYVPKYLYTLSSILYNYIIFLISLIVLVVVAAVLKVKPTIYLVQAPIALILILMISVGCGFILATLGVFFRDMEYLWSVALMLIMYMCAIFYEPERLLKSGFYWILKYNPLFCIIDIFRSAVFGELMNMRNFAYASIFSIVTIVIGIYMFIKKQDEFILQI